MLLVIQKAIMQASFKLPEWLTCLLLITPVISIANPTSLSSTVIIDNYNYGRYIEDALKSVLAQTHLPDEIIIIDDGSTDGSQALLKERYGGHPLIQLIFKKNEGQMRAFETGVLAASGDILFFLDSDDKYERRYLATALALYQQKTEVDAIVSGCLCHYTPSEIAAPDAKEGSATHYLNTQDTLIGPFSCISTSGKFWGGIIASTHSLRRLVANKIYPLPLVLSSFVNTYGDHALVLGSHILGNRVYSLSEPYVYYRRHDASDSLRNKNDPAALYREISLMQRTAQYLAQKNHTTHISPALIAADYLSNQHPEPIVFAHTYTAIVKDKSLSKKAKRTQLEAINNKPYGKKDNQRPPSPAWLSGICK